MREEYETTYHVLFLGIYTSAYIMLGVVTVLFGWEGWVIPIMVLSVLLCWGIHFAKVWTGLQRLYFYTLMELCGVLFCGYHPKTIGGMAQLLALISILLFAQREIKLIYLVVSVYPILILENIFLNRYLIDSADYMVAARLVLGALCLIAVVAAAHLFMRADRQGEKTLEEVQEQLAAAKRENEQFMSNVSHELRTPINAVCGMSELLLHRSLPEDVNADIQTIQDAGKRLMRQVGDMMDFSELQTGHFHVQNENYEPVSLITDVVKAAFSRDVKKQLEFAVDIDPNLPRVLYGDNGKIYKILICVLDNAIKFTNQGGGYLYISKRDEEYGINLNIDLWDTGIGMSAAELTHLYSKQAYQKEVGIERKLGGTGLGMAIVQGITAVMDGFCTISSEPGKGSHIHISIPQQIRNVEPAIHLGNASDYRVLVYFNMEKFTTSRVGTFYHQMLDHMRRALKIDVTEAFSLDELREKAATGIYTHIFVARWEYEMDPDYFAGLGRRAKVAVFTDEIFDLPGDSRITLLKKPIYILSITDYLKESMRVDKDSVSRTEQNRTGSGKTALVVDDDEMNLVVARGILRNLGFWVETSDSGEHAVRVCQENNYDIVFMDYMMPGLNGADAMHRIREIRNGYYKEIPIVALTANAVSSARADMLREGFDEFIPKPIEIAVLKKILNRVLEEADYHE